MDLNIIGKKKETNAQALYSEDMQRVSDLGRLNANMKRYTTLENPLTIKTKK